MIKRVNLDGSYDVLYDDGTLCFSRLVLWHRGGRCCLRCVVCRNCAAERAR
jgi:hypothetical protein